MTVAMTPDDDNGFLQAFRGRFHNVLRWEQLERLWGVLRNNAQAGWYIYAVGEPPPREPASDELFTTFLIEIDQYPARAQRRTNTDAGLPFGPAIVTFRVASLDRVARRAGRQPSRPGGVLYEGLVSLTVAGPSGELIELVAPASPSQ